MKLFELPDDYKEIKKIDLQKNVKLAVLVNVFSLLLAVALFFIGHLIIPIQNVIAGFLDYEQPFRLIVDLLILIVLMLVYMVLHELVHGMFFKKYSGKKAKYGFTGLYAYAKSDAYFNKKEYYVIGLSPIVILGAVLLILNFLLGSAYFWFVYIIQVINISGAAGDIYVSFIMNKLPNDFLVKDDGVSMTFFGK